MSLCPWCGHQLPHGATLVFQGDSRTYLSVADVIATDRKSGTYSVDVPDFCAECDDPCIPPIAAVCAPCARQRHRDCQPDRVMFLAVGQGRCRCAARDCPEGGGTRDG